MPLPIAALKTGALISSTVEASPVVVEVDFYRSMATDQLVHNRLENDNLADIIGTIKYLHTEVIPEGTQSDESRTRRKNDIDAIARWRMKVRNPSDLLQSDMVQHQDFGPFMAFDGGQNTDEHRDADYVTYGEFVGIQEQWNPQINPSFVTSQPYFWYSLIGFCPNLPFECTKDYPNCTSTLDTSRCQIPGGCPGKGNITSPDNQCKSYAAPGVGVVRGGLCEDGDDSGSIPTGERGCTYNYTVPAEHPKVSLDDLVGLQNEDCQGGRKCTDWHDFRQHCSNKDYKRKFKDGNLVSVTQCIEYDIHPACEDPELGCNNPACVAADPREVGLPFWLGRCNATANMIRAEALASAFGIPNATTQHELLAEDLRPGGSGVESCTWPTWPGGDGCNAIPANGGTYCTRNWGSACQACYIPGTVENYSNAEFLPICPLDIIDTPGYGDLKPYCSDLDSPRASNLCCLYTKSCDGNPTGEGAELNFDGFLLVATQKKTEDMAQFLFRLYNASQDEEQKVIDEARLREVAYWQWQTDYLRKSWLGDPAHQNETLTAIAADAAPCFAPASAPPSPGPGPTPGPGDDDPSSWAPVIVVICLLILAGTIGVVWYRKKLAAQARLISVEQSLPER